MFWAIVIVVLLLLIYISQKSETFSTSPDPGYVYDSGVHGPCIGILTGVHGNEPAGSITLTKLIHDGFFTYITKGSVRVMARANPIGLELNMRSRLFSGDLNRSFVKVLSDKDALIVDKFFEPCDLVIDFHEGWGFHQIQPDSLGSTVMANSSLSNSLAQQIVHDLNKTYQMRSGDAKKLFLVLPPEMACDIPTTFSCYLAQKKRHHILVETSGQNDVQPLAIRSFQIIKLVQSLLSCCSML